MKKSLPIAAVAIVWSMTGCSPPPSHAPARTTLRADATSPIDYQRLVMNTNGLGHFVRWRFTLDGSGEAGIEIDDSKNQQHVRDVRILTPEQIAAVHRD